MRLPRPAALLLVSLLVAGCATLDGGQGDPNYAADATENMRLGQQALERGDHVAAERYFEYVRQKYPFLEAAVEAELRLADNEYARERWAEARERYLGFIKLHPTHAKVDVAAYRAALTHFEDMPGDLFILPPSEEKDQTEVRAALRALDEFVRTYPRSSHAAEAKERADRVRVRLAEHELYVARFYAKRDRWPAVVRRLETLLEQYPGTPVEPQAFFDLHDAYVRLRDTERAQEVLRRVLSRLPGTPAAERAQRMLGSSPSPAGRGPG